MEKYDYLDFKFETQGSKVFGYSRKYKIISSFAQYPMVYRILYNNTKNSYGLNEVVNEFDELLITTEDKGIITLMVQYL